MPMRSRAAAGPTLRWGGAVGLVLAIAIAIAIATMAAPVAAAPARTARLTYSRGAGASDCPDADVIRAGVAARLGYEAFDDRAELLVVATVSRVGHTLEARIEIGGAGGQVMAERKLVSRQNDCGELMSAMELAISIAIDPLAGARPRVPPPSAPAPPQPAPAPPSPSPAPPQPAPAPPPSPPTVIVIHEAPPPPAAPTPAVPSAPVGFQARVGILGMLGSAPAPALGATLQVSARRRLFSIGVEGRVDLSSTTGLYRGDVHSSDLHAWSLVGSLVPCASRGVLEGCALLTAGVIRASASNLVMSKEVSAPLLALGARVGVEVPFGNVLSAGIHLDVLAPLTETVLQIGGATVWTSAPISGALGATVGVRFP